jgi:hypothetical protein
VARTRRKILTQHPATYSSPAAPHPFAVVMNIDATGPAFAKDREVLVRFDAVALSRLLGAIPASRFDGATGTEDYAAFTRLLRWLARQRG